MSQVKAKLELTALGESAELDEKGVDGLSVREAIARRTLIGLEQLVQAYKNTELDFDGALIAIRTLVETTLPFVDPSTKHLLNQVVRKWDDELEERRVAARELARISHSEFGAYA
jgi:hypothetical protein